MPYAISQGGWIGLSFLLIFAVICCYTGILLRRCIDLDPSIVGYPDVGQVAFGTYGRIIVSVLLYFELFAVAAEFLILEGDNLTQLIAWKGIKLKYFELTPEQSFIIISSIVMLPTVWLRDLRLLAYISAGGVIACVTVFVATSWFGISHSGFTYQSGNLVNIQGLPIAVGLYAFCYCGHAVFPSIYCSMKDKTKFTHVRMCLMLIHNKQCAEFFIRENTKISLVFWTLTRIHKCLLCFREHLSIVQNLLPWKVTLVTFCKHRVLVATQINSIILVPFYTHTWVSVSACICM